MPGGGSMQGMQNSLNNNKMLLRSKRLFKKERTFLNTKTAYLKAANGKIELRKASPEDLLKIRKKIIKERKRENIVLFSISILLICLFVYFGFKVVQHVNNMEEKEQKALIIQKETKYLHYLKKGDRWFEESNWYNAVFNYKKAKAVFPNDYTINYRIINTYTLGCEYNAENCNKAKKLLNELLQKFPDKTNELNQLKKRLVY
jgi:tetratricopeptide (TPR) repeat protein